MPEIRSESRQSRTRSKMLTEENALVKNVSYPPDMLTMTIPRTPSPTLAPKPSCSKCSAFGLNPANACDVYFNSTYHLLQPIFSPLLRISRLAPKSRVAFHCGGSGRRQGVVLRLAAETRTGSQSFDRRTNPSPYRVPPFAGETAVVAPTWSWTELLLLLLLLFMRSIFLGFVC